LIGVAGVAWLRMYLPQMRLASLQEEVPLIITLVPYLGPLLMVLTLVKVFRPEGPHDFWVIQSMSMFQVALGSLLTTAIPFGLFMTLYLASALGCLVLRYLQRNAESAAGPTVHDGKSEGAIPVRSLSLSWLGRADLGWTVAV